MWLYLSLKSEPTVCRDAFKCHFMNHREQGVFLLQSNTKSGKAQTPDLTIRKNDDASVAIFNFSPEGCEMWLLKSASLQ